MTITVHHLQVSQSERIVWLCEELNLEYNLVLHKRDPIFSPPAIKALNPLGAAPVLEDDSVTTSNGKPLILCESAAIVEWIIQKYGGGKLFLEPSHPNYADFIYWWHASNGTIQPAVSRNLMISMIKSISPDDPARKAYKGRLDSLLQHVNERLLQAPYLAGDEFTAADVMSVFSFTTVRVFFPFSLEGYDGILAWLKRCGERDAYKKAMAKGDPDMRPHLGAAAPDLFPPFRG